jgi:hypothetical protein
MHFFLKKTNELVKKQKMPKDQSIKQKKNGIYIRILLGNRKDKSFFVFKNQLIKVESESPLNEFEIKCLRNVYSDNIQWKQVCSIIKTSRGNKYPKDWVNTLRNEKLMLDNKINESEKGNGKQIVDIIMSGLLKSMNIEQTNTSPLPTIIVLETENDLLVKKSSEKKKDLDKIFLESYIDGTNEINKNIDFITRFNEKLLLEVSILINKNSEFEFGLPFTNLKIKNNNIIKNTFELYIWLKENIYMHIQNISNNYTIEDLGIEYIKKIDNKNTQFYIQFLY